MKLRKIGYLFLCLFYTLSYASDMSMDTLFDSLSLTEKQLFLKKFPKGGNLHFHLSGSLTPEDMLKIPASFCLNEKTLSLEKISKPCPFITIKNLKNHPKLYQKVIKAWSMKDFIATNETSAHDHFFNTFMKYDPLMNEKKPEILSLLRIDAAKQNITYLEPSYMPDGGASLSLSTLISDKTSVDSAIDLLLKHPKFLDNTKKAVQVSDKLIEKSNQLLSCPGHIGCEVDVRFKYIILREQPFNRVITQAVAAFMTTNSSKNIKSINIVQPEDGIIALRDYKKHMALLGNLHKRFPNVNITLHAGELSPNTVSPNEISFHINDAVRVAGANRIGHGTDIAHEKNAYSLLKFMREHELPVEINLTSNEVILDIKGDEHPLTLYLKNKVPVVLSTDDAGILRTSLTKEYLIAAERHKLSYSTLKNISRNSLSYSFLSGNSLWKDNRLYQRVSVCQKLKSHSCIIFLKESAKARAQLKLEEKFIAFEKKEKKRFSPRE